MPSASSLQRQALRRAHAGPAVAYADVLHILAYLPWPRGRPLASYGLLYLARDPTYTGVCWQRQLQKIVIIIVNVNLDF